MHQRRLSRSSSRRHRHEKVRDAEGEKKMIYINKIFQGDCIEQAKNIPDGVVNTCITSPPYFGLRDYGVEGQIGLEETPDAYVKRLVDVFREVHRVLKDDGTLWLNLGDSYAGNCSRTSTVRAGMGAEREGIFTRGGDGLKPKDLIGIPWRVAFALQADGWYLRQDIIWHKPNPMPESVTDRCTKAHEYIFLLSKSQRYYYDYEAIKEKASYDGRNQTKLMLNESKFKEGSTGLTKQGFQREGNPHERWIFKDGEAVKNKRSVWTVATKSFFGAHFATFPEELIKPCVLAGCPEGGLVYDPFMGSGTTAFVAKDLNRTYVGSELNPKYIDIANKRLSSIEFSLFSKV
jgi:DNA modification methylase